MRQCSHIDCKSKHYAKDMCRAHYYQVYRKLKPDKSRAATNSYRLRNLEEERSRKRAYYKANREHCNFLTVRSRAKRKEEVLEYNQQYRKNNKPLFTSYYAGRRAKRLSATPSWLTDQQKEMIREVYDCAAAENKHVDHIVPLQGKNVSGLHVPWNLRPLDATANNKKKNKLPPHEEQLAWIPATSAS